MSFEQILEWIKDELRRKAPIKASFESTSAIFQSGMCAGLTSLDGEFLKVSVILSDQFHNLVML